MWSLCLSTATQHDDLQFIHIVNLPLLPGISPPWPDWALSCLTDTRRVLTGLWVPDFVEAPIHLHFLLSSNLCIIIVITTGHLEYVELCAKHTSHALSHLVLILATIRGGGNHHQVPTLSSWKVAACSVPHIPMPFTDPLCPRLASPHFLTL